MKTRKGFTFGAIIWAVVAAGSAFGAVGNDAIVNASKKYEALFTASREAGEKPGIADMGAFLDKAYADVSIKDMTIEEAALLLRSVPVRLSKKTSAALDGLLVEKSKGTGEEAGRAAVLRLLLLPVTAKPEDTLKALQVTLANPEVPAAVAAGHGQAIFMTAESLDAAGLAAVHDSILGLKDSIVPTATTPTFFYGAGFILSVAKTLDADGLKSYSSLREKLLTAAQEKLKTELEADDRKRLESAVAQLNGAYARGELVGHPAPQINFAYFKDPENADKKITSLADLKGKVVVLDFWATWCGPCIASFPRVKALQHYYAGYDVVILGVTSFQGFVYTAAGRTDTAGDTKKEIALTEQFLKEKEVSWPIAISTQPVFNPDYGVMGIPDVVMIDPQGIVRYVGLHPAVPLEEKTAMIDKLLGEAHLVVPALLTEMRKPGAATEPSKVQ